jgi:subfamily B ATP-binding cassette protein MsbA
MNLNATTAQNSFKYTWLLSRISPYIKPYLFRITLGFLVAIPLGLLDGVTAFALNESEAIVQKAMDNLMKDRTVFIIAHRLSTIKNADRIAVINEGELVELGTHDELMNIENGQYKALYEMQFKKQEVSI